jgi:glutamate-1-semialdehyde 2,1-aminomutase
MFSIFFRDGEVHDYDQARDQHIDAFAAFFHSLLSQGVHLPPSAFEAWFVSAAHDDAAVDRVLSALPAAATAAAEAFARIEA